MRIPRGSRGADLPDVSGGHCSDHPFPSKNEIRGAAGADRTVRGNDVHADSAPGSGWYLFCSIPPAPACEGIHSSSTLPNSPGRSGTAPYHSRSVCRPSSSGACAERRAGPSGRRSHAPSSSSISRRISRSGTCVWSCRTINRRCVRFKVATAENRKPKTTKDSARPMSASVRVNPSAPCVEFQRRPPRAGPTRGFLLTGRKA